MAKTKASNAIDAHVGSRVRMRRMMLGMSQEKLGDALKAFMRIPKPAVRHHIVALVKEIAGGD
jgi:transcriptional regulator with XRE-family HTH domain